jgi:hypothetical protein
MNIILSFEATAPCLEVSLPDETAIFEMLARVKRAVKEEGKRQVVHLILKSEMANQFPPHGIIDFTTADELLYVDGEGPWWMYAKHTRVTASAIALKMICDVVNVLLTVDTVIKQ